MKSKIVMISVLFVMLAGFVAAFFIFPLGKGETDTEKLNRLLDHTGQAIYEQNKLLVESYNKAVDESLGGGASISTADRSDYHNMPLSGSLSEPAQSTHDVEFSVENRDIMWDMNSFYVYYSISEYFKDYLSENNNFLNTTYKVKSTDYDMYVKINLEDYGMDIYLNQVAKSGYSRNVKTSINYDWKNNKPISAVLYEMYLSESEYRTAKIDFAKKTYEYTAIKFIDSAVYEDIILKNEAYLKKNIDDMESYSVKYDDASSLKGYWVNNIKESDFNGVMTEEQSKFILDAYNNMEFIKLSDITSQIDTHTQQEYENGNHAVQYVENKYVIQYDDEGVYLKIQKNKGLDKEIEDRLLLLDDYYTERKQLTLDPAFDNLDYVYDYQEWDGEEFEVYDGTNFRKNITNADIKAIIPEDGYTAIKYWYENKYDEDKFYFEYEKIGDYYLRAFDGELALLKVKDKTIDMLILDDVRLTKIKITSDKMYYDQFEFYEGNSAYFGLETVIEGISKTVGLGKCEINLGYDEYISECFEKDIDYLSDSNMSGMPVEIEKNEIFSYSRSIYDESKYNDYSYLYDDNEVFVYCSSHYASTGNYYSISISSASNSYEIQIYELNDDLNYLKSLGVQL